MTTTTNNEYLARLNELSNIACDNIEDILFYLDVDYRKFGRLIIGRCPVHGGDNPTALNIYVEGDSVRGIWYCRTHHCEEKFKKNFIGFIRGALSKKTNNAEVTHKDAVQWLCDKLKIKSLNDIPIPTSQILHKRKLTSVFNNLNLQPQHNPVQKSRYEIRELLQIPAEYYIKRGYKKEILDKYDVGKYNKIDRILVPVYDIHYKHSVGFLARSLSPLCSKCKLYHPENQQCNSVDSKKGAKWINSLDFNSGESLYNYWFAKEAITKTQTIIIVESVGNVWRLVQNGIENCVALFGSQLTTKQDILLSTLPANYVILLMDNDEAGKTGMMEIGKHLKRRYHVKGVAFTEYNDVGDMPDEYFVKYIKPRLEKFK